MARVTVTPAIYELTLSRDEALLLARITGQLHGDLSWGIFDPLSDALGFPAADEEAEKRWPTLQFVGTASSDEEERP